MKCSNPACNIERRNHLWIVAGVCYCSPWCERNYRKHPNTAGQYKNVWNAIRRSSNER